ncbi:hypothetical protein [Neptuniibacter sp. QD37_11]|uniref:hypothetical protein n=1 Tax=Neptuniibacter sp. QD37_11 TaxID=3398209 RepID=UPI0039F49686
MKPINNAKSLMNLAEGCKTLRIVGYCLLALGFLDVLLQNIGPETKYTPEYLKLYYETEMVMSAAITIVIGAILGLVIIAFSRVRQPDLLFYIASSFMAGLFFYCASHNYSYLTNDFTEAFRPSDIISSRLIYGFIAIEGIIHITRHAAALEYKHSQSGD